MKAHRAIAGSLCGLGLLLSAGALAAPKKAAPQPTQAAGETWTKKCPRGAESCVVYAQNGGNTPGAGVIAARISIGFRDRQIPVVVVDVSSPAVRERGFGVGIDQNTPLIATLEQCDQIACRGVVAGPVAEALINQMKAGREAVVVYFVDPRTPARVKFSLEGFTRAMNALRAGS